MALRELATDARKYGALSNARGTIEITWELDQAAANFFKLGRSGRTARDSPRWSGFRTAVIEAMPRTELDAEAALVYAREGLCWRLEGPAERVLEFPLGFEAARESSSERKP